MTVPNSAALSLTGYTPRLIIDTRLIPGEANLTLHTLHPVVQLNTRSLLTDLPYMLSTFSERRRIIRETLDEVRDVIIQSRDTDIYLVLELDGYLYGADLLSAVTLECLNTNGDTATISSSTSAALFDFQQSVVVRGQTITPLVLKFTASSVASFFTAGLWTVDVFGVDATHANGAHWGTIEFEVRSLFEGMFITPLTGELNLAAVAAPRVTYRNVRPDTAVMSLVGNVPTIRNSTANVASPAALSMTGQQPVVSQGTLRTPTVGSITLAGIAPIRTP
jgi:hypothetical protein